MSWVVKCLMNNFVCVLSSDYSVWYILLHVLHGIFIYSHPDVFLVKVIPKICSKFIEEHSCRGVISICKTQLYWNHTSTWLFSCKFAAYFKTPFSRNTSGWLHEVPVLQSYSQPVNGLRNGSRVCRSNEGLMSAFKLFAYMLDIVILPRFFHLKVFCQTI